MKKLIISIFVVSLLGACAGTLETRATVALGAACDSYATVLAELAAQDLSEGQVQKVHAVNDQVRLACASDSTIDPAEGVEIVTSAKKTLTEFKEAF